MSNTTYGDQKSIPVQCLHTPKSNKPSFDIVVAGKTYMDLIFSGVSVPKPGTEVLAQSLTISPGGAANRAVAAAKLGSKTGLLTCQGDDEISHSLFQTLRQVVNLNLSLAQPCQNYRNPISVALSSTHDRSFITYDSPGPALNWPMETTTRTLFISLSDGLPEWCSKLRKNGTIVFGGVGWDASGQWSHHILDEARHIDVLIMNETEALHYTRQSQIQAAMSILRQYVASAVITRGNRGVVAATGDDLINITSPPTRAIDPTGAGDIFSAALMTGTAWSWPPRRCLELAIAASACSVQTTGGATSAPDPDLILQFINHCDSKYDWTWLTSHLKQKAEVDSAPYSSN